MNAQELRIGNYFKWSELASMGKDIDKVTIENINYHQFFEPIPLTEGILLKCGFSVREYSTCKEYYIGINELTKDWLFSLTWLEKPELINAPNAPFYRNGRHTIQYLHQLQNLYWCLCGEELEINL